MPVIINDDGMISDYRCFFCFAKAFENLIEKDGLTLHEKNLFTREMTDIYNKNADDFSAPSFSRALHVLLKQYSHNPDPYQEAKQQSNDLVLGMYDALKKEVLQSEDHFDKALRLAIAGNIIDFAISDNFDLQQTIHNVLTTHFSIDDSLELKEALIQAKTVLYLGDNCGEIVFDKLLIETIRHPNIFYAVRGAPVINDATTEDALYVGINRFARIISNGYDAPSTILEHCSEEFIEVFNKADVVISKGQGNLEGLLGKTGKELYFLLMVKCEVIANALGVKKGDFVVKRNNTTK